MVLKYETEIAALNAAIAKLDTDLADNRHWQALQRLKHVQTDTPLSLKSVYAPLRLEQDLARDPVYRARVRLLEAVQVLQQIKSDSVCDNPVSINRAAEGTGSNSENAQSPPPPLQGGANKHTLCLDGEADHHSRVAKSIPVAASAVDDLTAIRGISVSLRDRLGALGITRFVQIAAWTSTDRKKISDKLGLGREILQQNWIDQATLLASKSTLPTAQSTAFGSDDKPVSRVAPVLPPHPPSRPTTETHAETPHVLIKSAAHGLIRRLQANNDIGPTQLDAMEPQPEPVPAAPGTPSVPLADDSAGSTSPTPLHPSSQIVFSPQIVPEPRRVVAAQERQQQRELETIKPTSPDGDVTETSRTRTEAEPSSAPDPADYNKNEFKHLAVRPVLPKDKLRFRRLKQKAGVTEVTQPTEVETTKQLMRTPLPVASDFSSDPSREVSDAEVEIRTATSDLSHQGRHATQGADSDSVRTSPNPLSPPPVPEQQQTKPTFKKRRWIRRSGLPKSSDGGRSNFGDGQLWRQADPVLKGPALDDAAGLDPKFYAHAEEASVEIVRTSSKARPAGDPPPLPPHNGPEHRPEPNRNETAAKSTPRHPAKRIFKALKRK